MSRLVVLVLILSLGNASGAFAGETLLSVATRVTRQANEHAPLPPKPATATGVQKSWANALEQQGPAVASSGMRKRTKILIFVSAAVGFAATAYTIDHKVEDNTPSSHGLRED